MSDIDAYTTGDGEGMVDEPLAMCTADQKCGLG